jgi:predicted phosphodiesterase
MHRIREAFRAVPDGKLRILVTHHPLFAMPLGEEGALTKVADRSSDALAAAADAGVDILLAGHFHRTYANSARDMVQDAGPALVIQAGTATSTRLRGDELQSFNWLELVKDHVQLTVQRWNGHELLGGRPTWFKFENSHWRYGGREEEKGTPAEAIDDRHSS